MREIVRAAAKSGGISSGKIVLVGRQQILKIDFAELKMELQGCLKKLSLG
jgi:RNase P protein component